MKEQITIPVTIEIEHSNQPGAREQAIDRAVKSLYLDMRGCGKFGIYSARLVKVEG